jgi:hypothetical protein
MDARSRWSSGRAGGGGAESGEGGAAAAAAAAEKDVNVARIVSEDDELVDGIRGLDVQHELDDLAAGGHARLDVKARPVRRRRHGRHERRRAQL